MRTPAISLMRHFLGLLLLSSRAAGQTTLAPTRLDSTRWETRAPTHSRAATETTLAPTGLGSTRWETRAPTRAPTPGPSGCPGPALDYAQFGDTGATLYMIFDAPTNRRGPRPRRAHFATGLAQSGTREQLPTVSNNAGANKGSATFPCEEVVLFCSWTAPTPRSSSS